MNDKPLGAVRTSGLLHPKIATEVDVERGPSLFVDGWEFLGFMVLNAFHDAHGSSSELIGLPACRQMALLSESFVGRPWLRRYGRHEEGAVVATGDSLVKKSEKPGAEETLKKSATRLVLHGQGHGDSPTMKARNPWS